MTSGIAAALASGDTHATCWKNATVSGASATPTANCARVASRSQRGQGDGGASRVRDAAEATNKAATAPNDSQKPACSKAHGSHDSTATSAHAIVSRQSARRPRRCASATAASISSARCAGTPKPASSA
ncbi:hypothetical protein GALL_542400 [mine drainage metagenome]|uniref:Uncharacterized protein n=1 Tax=mine drainage metagenome TaxID=410659 RepID=A0A1J5NZK3_9ZZZZ